MRHEWDFNPEEGRDATRKRLAADMSAAFDAASPEEILGQAVSLWGERLAMVSSFGAESVALLHMVAQVDKDLPVLFLNTEMLFDETLAYQRDVAEHLGLTDVRVVQVEGVIARLADPDGDLHERAPDDCCHLRKTQPLEAALQGFDAWITGRKRFQTDDRANMPVFEVEGARTKVNPVAGWARGEAAKYAKAHGLPKHPLIAQGYKSIGCAPCTSPVADGEDERAGRWRGKEKTECGIHFGPDGVVRHSAA